MQRVASSDRFLNMDGTEAYVPWRTGEPNNINENCAAAGRNGESGVNGEDCFLGGRQYSCRIDSPPRVTQIRIKALQIFQCADIKPNCSPTCSFKSIFCAKSCGTCDTWIPESIGNISFLDNFNAENCKDQKSSCDYWAKNGNSCMTNPHYMLMYCPASCKQC